MSFLSCVKTIRMNPHDDEDDELALTMVFREAGLKFPCMVDNVSSLLTLVLQVCRHSETRFPWINNHDKWIACYYSNQTEQGPATPCLSFKDPSQYVNSPSPRYWLLWPGVLMMLVYSVSDLTSERSRTLLIFFSSVRRHVHELSPHPPEAPCVLLQD